MLRDPNVDIVLVIALLQSPALEGEEFVKVLNNIARTSTLPLVAVMPGGGYSERFRDKLEELGIPSFSTPSEGVKALKILYEFSYRREFVNRRKTLGSKSFEALSLT